jgi:hypothetical protein
MCTEQLSPRIYNHYGNQIIKIYNDQEELFKQALVLDTIENRPKA